MLNSMSAAFLEIGSARKQSKLITLDMIMINTGYMFCNGPAFNATVGEKVRFYIISLGTEAGERLTQSLCLQDLIETLRVNALMDWTFALQ